MKRLKQFSFFSWLKSRIDSVKSRGKYINVRSEFEDNWRGNKYD